MPQKNAIKEYAPYSYYHVYSRGANKQKIFLDASDYRHFLALFERYLSANAAISKTGVPYPSYSKAIKLLSYCLMTNHLHLLVHQSDDARALQGFMRSLMTSYSKYFNQKYHHYGSVFESRYKAKRIDDDSYLTHITRYIHMNPRHWENYTHSSLQFAFNEACPKWLSLKEALTEFSGRDEYVAFLSEYQENKDMLEVIKYQLADL